MFLSIIIPHYNISRPLLERCINSIVGQKIDESHEILVVDDGSQTPPSWITASFGNSNVRLIEAEHGGPGAARNRGIEEALGKYIMFVDADDFLINKEETAQCIDILKAEKPQILRFRYHVTDNPDKLPKRNGKINSSYIISGASFMANNNLSGSPCLYSQKNLPLIKISNFPATVSTKTKSSTQNFTSTHKA